MQRRLTSREKILAAVAAGAAVVYWLAEFVVSPFISRASSIDLELAQTRAEYARLLNVVQTAANTASEELRSDSITAGNTPTVELLRDIEMSAGPGVAIRRLQPMPSRPLAGKADNPRDGEGKLNCLQVQIDCAGQLPDLMAFFERLETANDLTRLRHFYLAPESNGQLHCQLTVIRMVAK